MIFTVHISKFSHQYIVYMVLSNYNFGRATGAAATALVSGS